MFGRMYDAKMANTGWFIFFIGFVTLYGAMFYLGMEGMPRRYFDYLPEFHKANIISSMGAIVMIIGLTIIITNLVKSARYGEKAEKNPWNGVTLEWQVPSPPPVENFDEIPVITKKPYTFN